MPVQLVERIGFYAQLQLNEAGAKVVVQVDDVVELLGAKLPYQFTQRAIEVMAPVDVGVVFEEGGKGAFSGEMHFSTRHLLFQASYHRRGEYNVTDGRKPQDEKLCHRAKLR